MDKAVAVLGAIATLVWGLFLLADGLFGIEGASGFGAVASVVGGVLFLVTCPCRTPPI